MHQGKYVLAQIMDHLPRREFDECVRRYGGERYAKTLSCRDQYLAMAFGQLAYRESLRDVASCLAAHRSKLYHLGFRAAVAKTTLASANERRDWRIYRDLAQALISEARGLHLDEPAVAGDLDGACYAIDSSSIELCLSLFPWAPYVATKAAVKLHLVMDMRGSIPAFFDMTGGNVNDMNFLDSVAFEPGSFYVMDRGYLDFGRLRGIHEKGAFFVTRAKSNILMRRRYSRPVDKSSGVLADQTVALSGPHASARYPDGIRRVTYRDETGKTYVFLTNNFAVSAATVALLYKNRWKIELLFKWIKQHLKIKAFWGRSGNAVKTQICIALCSYLTVAIVKKRLALKRNLYEILQIASVSLFDKTPMVELFSAATDMPEDDENENTAQMRCF